MTRRSRIWLGLAGIFIFGNLAGGVMAAVEGEPLHAVVHAGLLLLGAYLVRRLWRPQRSVITALPGEFIDLLAHLQQSIDAVAIEVERVGEGQRFMTRFFTENAIPRASGESAAKPVTFHEGQ